MKIAFVGGRGFHSNYGGVENAIREIASRLAQSTEFEVDVYGQGSAGWFRVDSAAPGLNTVSAPAFLSRFRGNAMLAVANCLYALLARRPQVLLLFASGPCLLAIVAKLLRVPVIAALRGIDSQRGIWSPLGTIALRLGEFSAVHIADECTVNSLEMYRHFNGRARGLVYIPNGASACERGSDDVLAQYGIRRDGYLLFAARIDQAKRLHVLLEAYRRLPTDMRLPLIIAGGQCKSPGYQRQLDALASSGVQFIGHVDNEILDVLMRNCAVFVLPSVKEGMSNSLLAAMNHGRCVLCADIAANADVVQHEAMALFEADNVQALAARLLQYCRDPAQRHACGQAMRQIVKRHYCWDVTAASYRDLILRTANQTAPATNI
jgi:glycosyltransferase involved in cell wall biosynthesis